MRLVILLTGPESSGTRFLASALATHPDIEGPTGGHEDPLDAFWAGDDASLAKRLERNACLLTRRSIPSGPAAGQAAGYMKFDDFDRLHRVVSGKGGTLVLLLTARSPWPHLVSWRERRASVRGSWSRSVAQYGAAYRHVFRFVENSDVPFLLLPLEAAILDRGDAIRGVWRLLGLREHALDIEPINVNADRYSGKGGTLLDA